MLDIEAFFINDELFNNKDCSLKCFYFANKLINHKLITSHMIKDI